MKQYTSKDVARVLLRKLGRASIVAAPLVTGCGAVYAPNPMHDGHIAIMADAKGMRAFMDGANGFITNGKASPDQDTAHWIARKAEEREITTRKYAPGLLDGLFSSRKPTAEQGS